MRYCNFLIMQDIIPIGFYAALKLLILRSIEPIKFYAALYLKYPQPTIMEGMTNWLEKQTEIKLHYCPGYL